MSCCPNPRLHTRWTVDGSGKMGHSSTCGGIRSSRKMASKGRGVKNYFFAGRCSGERWVKEDQLTQRHDIW
ncbi:hypothetical protein K443DRAFT_257419 [Laccaria amethystina LaAM-08-1]|uniref:Uncharacterized protein n=1 Tax=Laccaria amethystina LaAM-08-1 TaxID=1095629 RepID=A0A0C9XM97_9AGAR|nr:hypothetical protein K443DRAFT_257419 [Laccaria amethystina LaAM-08-1]